ncbi:MAG: TIGR03936 family radical SAM-associated protein [Clostridium sp.]|uniref:TIGR03936 family radical SAM-associated protein n=1 Tax=Clostridium sp. TaxID=1506 RepID=UPI002A84FD90|nr:TIGR03936 family radical SAM-associated protein [Clostridium sp.]MDY5097351.1 TIGR03936 family radical SAM-associated protein [Clostridium sp.]
MRYLIKFSKEDSIKFISHLDLMRTIQKIIRRADLPVEYSKGFNPHMSLSLAQPLSVGMSSKGEYMDLVLVEDLNEEFIKEKINENAPMTIRIIEVSKVIQFTEKKVPPSMALIDRANYSVKLPVEDGCAAEKSLTALLEKSSWVTIKKSKKGEREIDIRPLIKDIKYWLKDDYLIMNCTLACGSREHLSPELLSTYIKSNCEGFDAERFTYMERNEMYAEKNGAFVPLYKYV